MAILSGHKSSLCLLGPWPNVLCSVCEILRRFWGTLQTDKKAQDQKHNLFARDNGVSTLYLSIWQN